MLLLCSFPLSPLLFLGPRTTPFSPFSQHLNSMAQKRMRECEERDLTPPTAFNSILFSQLMFWKQFSRFSLHSPVHTDTRIHTSNPDRRDSPRLTQIIMKYMLVFLDYNIYYYLKYTTQCFPPLVLWIFKSEKSVRTLFRIHISMFKTLKTSPFKQFPGWIQAGERIKRRAQITGMTFQLIPFRSTNHLVVSCNPFVSRPWLWICPYCPLWDHP